MNHLHQISAQLLHLLGLNPDIKGIAAISGIYTVATVLSVVVVGGIMNLIEKLQVRLLEKVFGLKAALFICNYVTIAGTILHECAHALFAICTGAKVTEISFLDVKGNSLGHVSYIARGPFFLKAVQHALCACAPVIVGLIAEAVIIQQIFYGTQPIWGKAILWYLAVSVIDHMAMSSIDTKHYFQGIWAVAAILFTAYFFAAFAFLNFSRIS